MFSIPFFRVIADDGQPAHAPFIFIETYPDSGSKFKKVTSDQTAAFAFQVNFPSIFLESTVLKY